MIQKRRKVPKGQIIIKKSNKLVEAKYRLDIWEMRVFTKALSMIKKDDEDLKPYRIYLSDMIKEFGLSKGTAYKLLKYGAEDLNDRTIRIIRETPEGDKEFKTKIITGVDSFVDVNNPKAQYIDVTFHENLKKDLVRLKEQFTTYDIRNVVNLPSTYSYRVYELLKQYERIKTRTFELENLKKIVGAIEFLGKDQPPIDHYPLYGNFRQKVLLKAQKDLSDHTDINFTFEPIKRGRKITEIKFFISKNTPKRDEKNQTPKAPKYDIGETFAQLEPHIKDWEDYDEESLKKLIQKYGNERVLASYNQTLEDAKEKNISKPIKWFYTLVHRAPTLGLQRQEKQTKLGEKKSKIQERKNRIEDLKRQRDELNQEAGKISDQAQAKIQKENPKLEDEIIEGFRKQGKHYYYAKMTKQENLKRPSFQAMISNEIRKRFPQKFKKYDEISEQLKTIKDELQRIS
ncbi:hypothetical protein ES702_03389 [subsurface metagenome]